MGDKNRGGRTSKRTDCDACGRPPFYANRAHSDGFARPRGPDRSSERWRRARFEGRFRAWLRVGGEKWEDDSNRQRKPRTPASESSDDCVRVCECGWAGVLVATQNRPDEDLRPPESRRIIITPRVEDARPQCHVAFIPWRCVFVPSRLFPFVWILDSGQSGELMCDFVLFYFLSSLDNAHDKYP